MPTLDLYGPNSADGIDRPCFVLPVSFREQETWTGRIPRLPALSDSDRSAFVSDYRQIMERLDTDNCDQKAYWYSALGSRNTQTSLLYNGLEQLWRLRRYLIGAASSADTVSLVLPDRRFLPAVRRLADSCGFRLRSRGGFTPDIKAPMRGPVAALLNLLALCDWGRKHGDYGPEGCDVVVATVSGHRMMSPDRREHDFIFGSLQADLHDAGVKVMSFAHLIGAPQPAADDARRLPPPVMRTLVDLTRPRDAVGSIIRSLIWHPRLPHVTSGLGIDITALIHADVAHGRWHDLPLIHLQHRAFERLLRRSPGSVLVQPFENNGWEHACRHAAWTAGVRTIAFQHNALLQSAEKTYATKTRPQPDRILAAGPEAKRLLTEIFGYDDAKIGTGYSVRQSKIYRYRPKSNPPKAIRKLLVLLQGTPEMPDLITLLSEISQQIQMDTVTLRPHPSVDLASQLDGTPLAELPTPFRASDVDDLYEEILGHDATIFAGSSAGMESVALGVPAIYVDLGRGRDANPLKPEPALSRSIRGAAEAVQALRDLSDLTQSQFEEEATRARRFFEESFETKSDSGFQRVLHELESQRTG